MGFQEEVFQLSVASFYITLSYTKVAVTASGPPHFLKSMGMLPVQYRGWPELPYLCDNPMVSMIFNTDTKKRICRRESTYRNYTYDILLYSEHSLE